MTAEYDRTDEFRGARFTNVDLREAKFHSCDFRQVKITDSWLDDISISGDIAKIVVNDVDVTGYVQAELERRFPERAQLNAMKNADDYRDMWATVERLWADTTARFEGLPEPARHERVDGEWSFAETLRHLIFAIDAWGSRTVLDEPMPYHRLGLTHTPYPPEDAAALGIDLAAQPSYADVLEARADRVALVRRIVDELSDADLERLCTRTPAPGYPDKPNSVGTCLRVIMFEEIEHRRYLVRDLAVLEAR